MTEMVQVYFLTGSKQQPLVVKVTIGRLLLEEIKQASSTFELRLIGEKILKLKIEDELESLVLAWQERWTILSAAVGRGVQAHSIYEQVLADLREQEIRVRAEIQARRDSMRDHFEGIEDLIIST